MAKGAIVVTKGAKVPEEIPYDSVSAILSFQAPRGCSQGTGQEGW